MDVAAMNVRIMFQKNETVSDAIGNHTNRWADYYSCHATISDSQGKSSVEAGASSASKLGELVATHVIPRPHSDVEMILPAVKA